MSKNKVTCRDFKRYPGSVFVTPTSVPDTARLQLKAKDWTGVATDIVSDTPLRSEPTPQPVETREHQSKLTPDTIHAIMEQMDRRWLSVDEILTVATSDFRVQADRKSLQKVLHGLFMRGALKDKQVGPQDYYRYLAVNWRLQNSITVNMEKLQRVRDYSPAWRIKDEMYNKYNLLTVENVTEALDTLAETDSRMLVAVIDGTRQYHWKVESAPAPEKPKGDLKALLADVDARLGVQS